MHHISQKIVHKLVVVKARCFHSKWASFLVLVVVILLMQKEVSTICYALHSKSSFGRV